MPAVMLHPAASVMIGQRCNVKSVGSRKNAGSIGTGVLMPLRGVSPSTFMALIDLSETAVNLEV